MHKAKKNLSQNFLQDEVVLQDLINYVKPASEDSFLEIGPGKGVLTERIIPQVKNLDAVELDKDLMLGLKILEQNVNNFNVHHENILNFNMDLLSQPSELRVLGNLPYNISSAVVLWSFKNIERFTDMHYMFQKEFGQRLFSQPGKKSYGRLSVLTQYMTEVTNLFTIMPESFKPRPSVESIFVKLTPIPGRNINSKIAIKLQEVTRIVFSKRRKMLSKSLKDILGKEDFINLDINPSDRPEDLRVEDFVKISELLIK